MDQMLAAGPSAPDHRSVKRISVIAQMTEPMGEFEIDRRMSEITALMVAGTATPRDEGEYQQLGARRTRMMTPERPQPRRR